MNIGIIGYGKMGKEIEKIALQKGHNIIFKINSKNTDQLTKDNMKKIDVAIEFSNPDSAFKNIHFCINQNVPIVSGTTGWQKKIADTKAQCLQKNGSFLHSPNFSVGVNLFFAINKYVAELMKDKKYKVSIMEKHHKMKKDSPSGTAIKIENDINKKFNYTIPIQSKRLGTLKGEHMVRYISEIDEIQISHKAKNRSGFAKGAILAAEFIYNKKGVFNMNDIIQNL
tara:strand:+ start:1176 stop:1853 length:678 start_codon:yes stop_codon:yes gene_type:complete